MLWNPLKRQPLRIRPEERVRLQILEYFILQSNLPASRIAAETPVPSRFSKGRTDLLCYDDAFQPLMLIECKAESVRLGPKAATQSAVYNRFVKAPWLMLSNGIHDALFHVSDGLQPVDESDYPGFLHSEDLFVSRDPEYWISRGFLPGGLDTSDAYALADRLALLFHASSETRSYLDFIFPGDEQTYAHYYILLPAAGSSDTLMAASLIARNRNEAVFSAVANRNNQNIACFSLALSAQDGFHSPKLFLSGTNDVPMPDISDMEQFWISDTYIPMEKAISPRQGDAASRQLATILEHILIPIPNRNMQP